MELDEHGFLEELLSLRRDAWEDASLPSGMGDLFSWGGEANFGCFKEFPAPLLFPQTPTDPPELESLRLPPTTTYRCLDSVYRPFGIGGFSVDAAVPENQSSSTTSVTKGCRSASMDDEELGVIRCPHGGSPSWEGQSIVRCKVEKELAQSAEATLMSLELRSSTPPPPPSSYPDRKQHGRAKRAEGQPSKNLMAERRRRKRLNDRLSMLRSVVPKISKMDRTSILGDTIDYMKELLDRIKCLQQEVEAGADLLGIFRELNPTEVLVRTAPKFDVERRDADTRIKICCAAKPGLLFSTVNTLEALGLEIQQCVVSCFNDFGMQASCSEDVEQLTAMSCEDIKQALFRNAGYGGRCV